jgi:hypothetical protein
MAVAKAYHFDGASWDAGSTMGTEPIHTDVLVLSTAAFMVTGMCLYRWNGAAWVLFKDFTGAGAEGQPYRVTGTSESDLLVAMYNNPT